MPKLIRSLMATLIALSLTLAFAPAANAAPLNWREVYGDNSQKIYGSGEIKKKDASTLKAKDVRTIIALTGSNPKISGVTFVKVKMSALGVGGASTAAGAIKFKKLVTDSKRRAALAKALQVIAAADGSVAVQCWKGKDRTGWTMAIIGHILGQSESQIMKEFRKYRDQPSWLNSALGQAKKDYGSIDGFLTKIGVDESMRQMIRTKYGEVVPVPAP